MLITKRTAVVRLLRYIVPTGRLGKTRDAKELRAVVHRFVAGVDEGVRQVGR